jgi:phosphohistidine phosphatase
MRLYLVRHAEAKDAKESEKDEARKLTKGGRREAKRLAKHLRKLDVRVSMVWHSGLVRAGETARPIAKGVKAKQLRVHAALRPGAPLRRIVKEIDDAKGELMLVGHEPSLSPMAAKLVVGKESAPLVRLAKPSVLCLERDDGATRAWQIVWLLTSDSY